PSHSSTPPLPPCSSLPSLPPPPPPTLFPYTTLFRSPPEVHALVFHGMINMFEAGFQELRICRIKVYRLLFFPVCSHLLCHCSVRSEEHTSELQSRFDLVCRLLLEKKKSADGQPGNCT